MALLCFKEMPAVWTMDWGQGLGGSRELDNWPTRSGNN